MRRTLLARFVYSAANYWGSLVGDTAMPVIFLVVGIRAAEGRSMPLLLGAMVAGWLLWTFLEYVLHRWILHGPPTLAQEGHAEHHRDEVALLASPMFAIPVVQVVLAFGLSRLVGWAPAAFFLCGAASGYASFSLLHHLFHHFEPRRGALGRLRECHEVHHRMARWNYGTTTSLWDRTFGTWRDPDSVAGIVRARET